MEGIVIGLSIHHQRGCVRMKDQKVHPLWVHLNVQHGRCRVIPQHLDGRRTCRRFDEIGLVDALFEARIGLNFDDGSPLWFGKGTLEQVIWRCPLHRRRSHLNHACPNLLPLLGLSTDG